MIVYIILFVGGLIVSFIFALLTPMLSCCCMPPIFALPGGYVSCMVKRPELPQSIRHGVVAGVAAGAGIGVGYLLNTLIFSSQIYEQNIQLVRELVPEASLNPETQAVSFIIGLFIAAILGTLLVVGASAGLGAAGGAIWRHQQKPAADQVSSPPAQ